MYLIYWYIGVCTVTALSCLNLYIFSCIFSAFKEQTIHILNFLSFQSVPISALEQDLGAVTVKQGPALPPTPTVTVRVRIIIIILFGDVEYKSMFSSS